MDYRRQYRAQFFLLDLLDERQNGVHVFPLPYIKELTCNFDKENEIGQGAYGIVYKGKDENFPNGKEVAIKRLNMNYLKDVHETRQIQERSFDQEVKILSSFQKQHMIGQFDYQTNLFLKVTSLPLIASYPCYHYKLYLAVIILSHT